MMNRSDAGEALALAILRELAQDRIYVLDYFHLTIPTMRQAPFHHETDAAKD